jgi:hypothetical protein
MIKQSLVALSLVTASYAASAQEQSRFYAEAAYGGIKTEAEGFSVTPGVGLLRLGMNLDKNFSTEFMVGTTIADAKIQVSGVPVTLKYENIYGLYLKGKAEIAPNLDVYGRLGYIHGTASASALGVSASTSNDDFSYGVGAQYSFSPTVYGTLDYMSYFRKNGTTAAGPSLGVGVKF